VVVLLLTILLFGGLDAKSDIVACFDVWAKERKPVAEIDPKQNWSQQAFDQQLQILKRFFKDWNEAQPEVLEAAIFKKGMRNIFFFLEELSGVYEGADKDFFADKRERFKAIEDAIGRLDLKRSLEKRVREKLHNAKLENHFNGQALVARAELVALLENEGLYADPVKDIRVKPKKAIRRLQEDFEEYKGWDKVKKDKRYQVEALATFAEQLASAIEKMKYDDADIELGLHKMRRALRKFGQRIALLSGLVAPAPETNVSPEALTWLAQLRRDNGELAGAFIKWSTPVTERPILIPENLFALFSELVTWIGKPKDAAELQIYVHEALVEMKVSKAEQDEVMAQVNALSPEGPIDHQAISRAIQQRINALKVLRAFAREIRALNP
jgi:hypothetical protein